MRVPESLVALLSDLRVRGGEHEQHAQEHDMSSNATSLHVVDLHGGFGSHERAFHVVKVDIVRGNMHDGPEEHGVGDLAVKPLTLVQRQPSDFGPYVPEQVPAHGQDDNHGVDAQAEAGSARKPDAECEGVECFQAFIAGLLVPSEDEKEDVEAMK